MQGGSISPTLVNFTLNGLEKAVNDSILSLTKSKEKRIVIKRKDGTRTRIPSSLFIVRFADEFVVLARSKHILQKYVRPAIQDFIEKRNLVTDTIQFFTLSDQKSTLNFLGYSLKFLIN